MSLPTSRGKTNISLGLKNIHKNSILSILFLVISLISTSPASAHTVKIDGDVGGTLHIEPNDNPRAGEPAQAWFALTRKGGKVLPLAECNCQLAIYAEPYSPGEPALLEPALKPVQAERYQDIPGAEIVFPKPGAYQLQLKGKPVTGNGFRPFALNFSVTVAAGKAQPVLQIREQGQSQAENINLAQPTLIVAIIFFSLGVLVFVIRKVTAQREQGTGDREQRTGDREQGTGNR
ncbi:hypothetical protein B6N60_02372 [Richelia sinica FACHB-800]|uniref:Transketolase n=1 Tax=Richelia sinica FACHB-800 TaxID=1357546 RepID=A0A975Y4Z3_9NOST|nr:hypothetical protein [Richelia sinica]QXE23682.1 hypothetical protein B6N60_02372 [Richelia sinica FACHB-800]